MRFAGEMSLGRRRYGDICRKGLANKGWGVSTDGHEEAGSCWGSKTAVNTQLGNRTKG